MNKITEAVEHREVWFIFSPLDMPWANLRLATFTMAVNAPFLELIVIHNEVGHRAGVRVWDDIVRSERWFKVRQLAVPTADEVKKAAKNRGIDLNGRP